MTELAERPRLLVLYDADCGICTRSARLLRRLDRRARLHLLPFQAAGEMADAPPIDVLREALHVRDEDGSWHVAGAAGIRIGQEITLLRPLALMARIPLIRRFVDRTYALVADNRQGISRVLGDDGCRTKRRTE